MIVYADGRREMLRVGQQLSQRSPELTIDLARRGMQGIFIDAAPQSAVVNVIGVRR